MNIITIGELFKGFFIFNSHGKLYKCDQEFFKNIYFLKNKDLAELLIKRNLFISNQENKIIFRKSHFDFGRASYEITERCNFYCKHCYMGKRKNSLSTQSKKKVIDVIYKSGSIFLQLTGGEPLIDVDFCDVYSYSYLKGFIITLMTNGYYLDKHIDVLKENPPYKLSVSLYGGTSKTFDKFVSCEGAFDKVVSNLYLYRNVDIAVKKVKIILTKYNQHELNKMIDICSDLGFEYSVYKKLNPKLNGEKTSDIECENKDEESAVRFESCLAGKNFFNVDCLGMATICKLSREPSINVLTDDILKLKTFYDDMELFYGKQNNICLPKYILSQKKGGEK